MQGRLLVICSGGQTGVDRAALDFAVLNRYEYAGWCPNGGIAEDMLECPGLIERYPLLSGTPSTDPAQRTEWNVRDSDATLILVVGDGLQRSPGTLLAKQIAENLSRPVLVVDIAETLSLPRARAWIDGLKPHSAFRLNLAGPRESQCPGIYSKSRAFLSELLDVQLDEGDTPVAK